MKLGLSPQLLRRYAKQLEESKLTLESMLCDEQYFGLTTATPVQRAICRVFDGRPLGLLAHDKNVSEYMGDVEKIQGIMPIEGGVFSGVRTAKSLFSAALAVYKTQTCDASGIRKSGEIPRVSIISLSIDNAEVIMNHLVGTIESSPALHDLLVGEPKAKSLMIRQRSTGKIFEIKVVAGKRAGGSVVSRWCATLILDEAARMLGAGDGVVNMDDIADAVRGRRLTGAMILYISSPWAPFGPAYKMVQEYHRKPSKEIVVIRCPANAMNPFWWTKERIEALKKIDQNAYRTDVLAEFRDQEESLISSAAIRPCVAEWATSRASDLCTYYAAIDPATRSNAWTLVIGTERGNKKRIVYATEWRGSKAEPLDPSAVFADMALIFKDYKITKVISDQWSADALRSIAKGHGIKLVQDSPGRKEDYQRFKTLQTYFDMGQIEIPNNPTLIEDLNRIMVRVTQSGVSIVLPQTSDGRHCDYAPAVAKIVSRWMKPEEEKKPERGTAERIEYDEEKRRKALIDKMRHDNLKRARSWIS